MNTTALRQKFEAKFPKPKNVIWSDEHNGYGFADRKYRYQATKYRALWTGFVGCFDLILSEQRDSFKEAGQ